MTIRTVLQTSLVTGVLCLLLCSPAAAQTDTRYELGIHAGVGDYGYSDDTSRHRGVVGAELCAFCSSRRALFAEYSHWTTPSPSSSTGYRAADSFGGGLRFQSSRRSVKPFFDAGAVVGSSRFGTRSRTTAGAVFGTGAKILAGQHVYIRPQARLYIMSQSYIAVEGGVGIGWRF